MVLGKLLTRDFYSTDINIHSTRRFAVEKECGSGIDIAFQIFGCLSAAAMSKWEKLRKNSVQALFN